MRDLDIEKLEALAKAVISALELICNTPPDAPERIWFVGNERRARGAFEVGANPHVVLALIARVKELEAALEPFVTAFEKVRGRYALRYTNPLLGEERFDEMPDEWPTGDCLKFNMGQFRTARRAMRVIP